MAPESACTRYVCAFTACLRDKNSNNHQFQIPERLAPGKFDIWGSSHQIFHVAILCAMYTHVTALLQGFTTCHTLDVCQLQGVHRANRSCIEGWTALAQDEQVPTSKVNVLHSQVRPSRLALHASQMWTEKFRAVCLGGAVLGTAAGVTYFASRGSTITGGNGGSNEAVSSSRKQVRIVQTLEAVRNEGRSSTCSATSSRGVEA